MIKAPDACHIMLHFSGHYLGIMLGLLDGGMPQHLADRFYGYTVGQRDGGGKCVPGQVHVQGPLNASPRPNDFQAFVHLLVGRNVPSEIPDVSGRTVFQQDPFGGGQDGHNTLLPRLLAGLHDVKRTVRVRMNVFALKPFQVHIGKAGIAGKQEYIPLPGQVRICQFQFGKNVDFILAQETPVNRLCPKPELPERVIPNGTRPDGREQDRFHEGEIFKGGVMGNIPRQSQEMEIPFEELGIHHVEAKILYAVLLQQKILHVAGTAFVLFISGLGHFNARPCLHAFTAILQVVYQQGGSFFPTLNLVSEFMQGKGLGFEAQSIEGIHGTPAELVQVPIAGIACPGSRVKTPGLPVPVGLMTIEAGENILALPPGK